MYHIIINPASKSGRGVKLWKSLEPIFNERNISYKLIYSEYSGHIIKIVNKLTDPLEGHGHVKLIVLGGDGTMNEVLQGVMDWDSVSIGYIPTGSSNDFARAIGYPKKIEDQLDAILSCDKTMDLDVGLLTYLDAVDNDGNPITVTRRFDVSCGVGFDAAVCEESIHNDSNIKKLLNRMKMGKLSYLAIALKNLLSSTGVSVSYTIDNDVPVKLNQFLFIAAMENKYEGGGFMFCPKANPTDGKLDVCVVSVKSKATILCAIPLAFFGKHTLFKGVDCKRANKIRIRTSEPLWIHTDGEVHRKSRDFMIETLPGKLHLMI